MNDLQGFTHVSARTGQEFKIELQTYPGSGAMWRYASSEGPQLISKTTQTLEDNIGAAAIQVFTLRGDNPGSYHLIFELKRSWEPSPRDRKEIQVEVV
jgi:predicted secreted protein